MMASGKSSKRTRVPSGAVITRRNGLPWLTIIAVVVILGLAGAIFGVVYSKQHAKDVASNKLDSVRSQYTPTATHMDPSTKIPGIYVGASVTSANNITYPKYKAALHVTSDQRVAYDRYPPVGGPHDGTWAACNGVVYTVAVRDENMVHTLEHGAIWITYNPKTIKAGDLDKLKAFVVGQNYISLSPYPGLDSPISVQSWAHQLKVQTADDPRIQEFIVALQENPYITPEVGGSCVPSSDFDPTNPPPFDQSPRGTDAIPLNGSGLLTASNEGMDVSGAASGATGSAAAGSGGSAALSTSGAAAGTTVGGVTSSAAVTK